MLIPMVSKSFKYRNRKEHKEHKDKTGIYELVYALYGLTPEEKALVQAAAK
jgi:hypothetical protein